MFKDDNISMFKIIDLSAISHWFLTRPRKSKRIITLLVDFIAVMASLWIALSLRYSALYQPSTEHLWVFLLAPIIAIPIFIKFGLYRAIIRYLGMRAIWTVVQAISLYIVVFAVVILLAGSDLTGVVPRTVYGINLLILLVFIGGSRLVARWWFSQYNEANGAASPNFRASPVLIYGAGGAGAQLAVALRMAGQLRPVGYIDDEKSLIGQQVGGLTVYPFARLAHLIEKYHVIEVLLAIPSVSRSQRNKIIQKLEPFPIHVRTLPSLNDLAKGTVRVTDVQEVDIADLLGRDQVQPIDDLLSANIRHKVVMVTGAGGSIGSELCRQIIKLQPATLILFELNEFNLYRIEQDLKGLAADDIPTFAILGSVLNEKRVEAICNRFKVDTIYHTAAYKHVPMVEHNTSEGIQNNVFGTLSCAKAAIATEVETFVLISTDKAVRPTNTMGASKRLAELILQALAQDDMLKGRTRFTMVRFGNVLGSSGSVVPLFRQQIANGGPITVTDPRIIRYFMTIPEAAELVIQAGAMGEGGDVFVLDMGEPVSILSMAKRMIHLSGHHEKDTENPEGDIEVVYTGLRPGEKLYEELLIGDKVTGTEHQKIMRAQELITPWTVLDGVLEKLTQACEQGDYHEIRSIMTDVIDGYEPQCAVEDWLK
jgi:FlaA1/EpsC-like NDP-sugar epimerase